MDRLDQRLNDITPGEWYPQEGSKYGYLDFKTVNEIKKRFHNYDFELTFNSDYTKIKKTIWIKNKPKL